MTLHVDTVPDCPECESAMFVEGYKGKADWTCQYCGEVWNA